MFDHVGIVVKNLDKSKILYLHVLAAIGYELLQDNTVDNEGWLVFGTTDKQPFLVVSTGRPSFWGNNHMSSLSPIHCAFAATSCSAVDGFHSAGLIYGATDNGKPGDRGRGYYAAYLIDFDGNNIEAGVRD